MNATRKPMFNSSIDSCESLECERQWFPFYMYVVLVF